MLRFTPRTAFPLLVLLVACVHGHAQQAGTSLAPAPNDPLARPVEVMPLADHSLILDIARSGKRIIAVGERGHVLYSDDDGNSWTQSAGVPLRSTLTAVAAAGSDVWAVGHDGVILHSADAGETWEIQRRDPRGQPGEGIADDIRQGAPFLDVLFTDASHGIAIGAYSLLLETSDGGKHWNGSRMQLAGSAEADAAAAAIALEEEQDAHTGNDMQSSVFSAEELKIGQESDPHLNSIARTGSGDYVIVGERGAVFHSTDGGRTWLRSQLPYDGSMFGIVGFEDQHVLAFGLRGHVFESTDLGTTWSELPTGSELSLMGGAPLAGGGVVVVGANGVVLRRSQAADALHTYTESAAGVIAGVLPLGSDGALLIASENGLSRIQPK